MDVTTLLLHVDIKYWLAESPVPVSPGDKQGLSAVNINMSIGLTFNLHEKIMPQNAHFVLNNFYTKKCCLVDCALPLSQASRHLVSDFDNIE